MTALSTIAPAPSLWRDRRFTAFWTGYTVSQFGDRVTDLAIPLIAVVVLDASPSQVGLLTAAVWLPNVIAMFIGTWVDRRRRKRRILVSADLLRAAALVTVPIVYFVDALTLDALYAVALVTGVGQVIFNMAYQGFYVSLVKPASYVDANSKLSTSRAASFVGGPAIGGALIHAVTAPVAVIVDAVSFLFSAAVIGRLRIRESAPAGEETPRTLRQAAEGLRYIVGHPILRTSLGCTTTINFFTFIAQALLIMFASRTLGLTDAVIGLTLGIGAAGGVIGAVLAPRIASVLGAGPTIMLGAVLFPAPLAIAAMAAGSPLTKAITLSAAELLSSIGVMLFDVNQNAVLTAVTPDHMRARRAGAFATVNYGSRPLGAITGGLLGSALGLRPTLLVAAIGGSLAVLWLVRSPIPRLSTIEATEQTWNREASSSALAARDGRTPAAVKRGNLPRRATDPATGAPTRLNDLE